MIELIKLSLRVIGDVFGLIIQLNNTWNVMKSSLNLS